MGEILFREATTHSFREAAFPTPDDLGLQCIVQGEVTVEIRSEDPTIFSDIAQICGALLFCEVRIPD